MLWGPFAYIRMIISMRKDDSIATAIKLTISTPVSAASTLRASWDCNNTEFSRNGLKTINALVGYIVSIVLHHSCDIMLGSVLVMVLMLCTHINISYLCCVVVCSTSDVYLGPVLTVGIAYYRIERACFFLSCSVLIKICHAYGLPR